MSKHVIPHDHQGSSDVVGKYVVTRCRICLEEKLFQFLDLHSMPVPNGFLQKEDLGKSEPKYALGAAVCENCWLVQLTRVVPPELMFSNYLYIPSTSSTMIKHFDEMARTAAKRFKLQPGDLVMDIGSNDGTLLNSFRQRGLQVLGVDPATNLAALARMKGIDTINAFFSSALAKELAEQGKRPKVITATNVVAHMDDLHDFCSGVEILLADDGVLAIEFPYLLDLLEKNEFDTIYHEHLSYFSLKPLIQLFKKYKMKIFDVLGTSVHGGSMRVFVAREGSDHASTPELEKYLKMEEKSKLGQRQTYTDFADRVYANTADLIRTLKALKAEGKRVVGYGASAKGNVLLNFCKISTDLVEYVVDSISYKQWKYTPGTHIPIYPEQKLEEDTPDFVLLLAWNFKDEIMAKQAEFRKRGGRFIVPIPKVTIVE